MSNHFKEALANAVKKHEQSLKSVQEVVKKNPVTEASPSNAHRKEEYNHNRVV